MKPVVIVDNRLTGEDLSLLRGLLGRQLNSIEGVFLVDYAWNGVRLHANEGSIDIRDDLDKIPVDGDENTDDVGIISVHPASSGPFAAPTIEGKLLTRKIDELVTGVAVISSELRTYEHDALRYRRSYAQAIALSLANGSNIVLDKGPWFDEALLVREGAEIDPLLYDERQDWEDDPDAPDTHYEMSKSIIAL